MLANAFTQKDPFHVGEEETCGLRETVRWFGKRRPVPWSRIGGLVTTFFDRFLNGMSGHK